MNKLSRFVGIENINEVPNEPTNVTPPTETPVAATPEEQEKQELTTIAASLEAISDEMKKTLDNGGMDKSTASITRIAVESLLSDLSEHQLPIASMEAFDFDSTKATKVSIEYLDNWVSKLKAKIQ